jgi:hypothetical protein
MRVLNSLESPSGEPDPDGPLADATRHAFLGRGYAVLREWTAAEPHLMAAYGILDAELPPGSERTIDVLIDVLRPRNVVFPKAAIGEAQRHLAAAAQARDVPAEKVRLLEWHAMLALPTTIDSDEARKDAILRMRAHLAQMRSEQPAAEATLIAASESILMCAWSGFPELGHEDAQQILGDVDAGRLAHSGPGLLMALGAGGYAAGLVGHQQFCVEIYERFGDRYVEALGLGHRSTFDIHNNAGFGLAALGREREAIEVLQSMLPWTVLEYGESGPHAQLVRNNLRFAESRLAARTPPE